MGEKPEITDAEGATARSAKLRMKGLNQTFHRHLLNSFQEIPWIPIPRKAGLGLAVLWGPGAG